MSRSASQRAGAREPRERVPDAAAGAAVARAIGGWRPRTVSERAQRFAREVVSAAAPARPARARALLFAASRLAEFGESVGLELTPVGLLHPSVIERFTARIEGAVAPATRRTLRSNLRALERARRAHPRPQPVPLPRERAKRPYGQAEIAGYLRLAQAQPTVARRMRAQALVCLGAGAGIVAGELRHLRGTDVVCRAGGLVVRVSGRRARAVPVLERFQEPLREAALFAGAGYLVGGSAPARRNLTDTLTAALSSDASLPRLEPGRVRATWLSECARLIGLGAFMQAAGIRCSQRLGDVVAQLPQVGEAEALALLGGGGGGRGGACAP